MISEIKSYHYCDTRCVILWARKFEITKMWFRMFVRSTRISLFQFIQFDRYWVTFDAPTMSSKQNGPLKLWLNSLFQIDKSTWNRFCCIQPCHLKNINWLSLEMCMLNWDSLSSGVRPPQCISVGQTSHASIRFDSILIVIKYCVQTSLFIHFIILISFEIDTNNGQQKWINLKKFKVESKETCFWVPSNDLRVIIIFQSKFRRHNSEINQWL